MWPLGNMLLVYLFGMAATHFILPILKMKLRWLQKRYAMG